MDQECSGALDLPSTIILVVGYSLGGVISIAGNSIILWAIYTFPSLRTSSNIFLGSLAVADLSVGLIIDPFWVARCILTRRPYQDPFKIAIDFLWLQTTVITTFSLCAVTLDRYIAVVHVFKYPSYVTVNRSLATIASIWTFSLVFASLRLFITDISSLPSLWISSLILTFIIPLHLMIACYAKILKEAQKQSRQIRQQENSGNNQTEKETSSRHGKRKANITVGIILGLFILLWLPTLVTSVIHAFTPDSCLKTKLRRAWLWAEMIAFFNSAINPWIYAVRNSEFRDAIRIKFPRF